MKSSAVFSGVGVFLLATLTNVQMAGAAPEATTTAVPSPPGTAPVIWPPAICRPKGLTWDRAAVNPVNGTVTVSCHGNVEGHDCNPYTGDTSCKLPRPILCIEKNAAAFPVPASVNNSSQYNKWAYGVVGTTPPVSPCAANLKTIKDADAVCQKEFGPNFRVAEHHDGWGWAFQAYGNVGNPQKRFWVNVNDQPNGNCWKN